MSIEIPVGGQFELLHRVSSDSLTNGYTSRFKADGQVYRLLRFHLGFVGQTIGISLGPSTTGWGSITTHRHDGVGSHKLLSGAVNSLQQLVQRGTGGLEGYAMPRKSIPGWLLCFSGYTAITATASNIDQWKDAGGAYLSMDARVMCQKNGTPANDWDFDFGFGSYAGEAGAYSLVVEGLRA